MKKPVEKKSNTDSLECVRCHRPVIINRDLYQTFEKMHWHCFHLEYEHTGDPDGPCDDPSCHEWRLLAYEERLRQMGVDPKQVHETALQKRFGG